MFLFCFFPLCKHSTLSAAVNVCSSPSKCPIKKSLSLLFLPNKVHIHMCTDSHKQQFLCMSRAAKERRTEAHQPLDKPCIPPNSTYMFQCARKKQILDSQWEARGAEQLRSLHFQRILGDPRPAHWMSRLPAICAPIRHIGAYAAMETSINTTCECHCLANVITAIKQTEKGITAKAFTLWEYK